MKWWAFLIWALLAMASFLISGLFFLNSGIIDLDEGRLNEVRAVEIVRALDEIPCFSFDDEDVKFRITGEVLEIEEGQVLIGDYGRATWFNVNSAGYSVGDYVHVVYGYNVNYDIEVISFNHFRK